MKQRHKLFAVQTKNKYSYTSQKKIKCHAKCGLFDLQNKHWIKLKNLEGFISDCGVCQNHHNQNNWIDIIKTNIHSNNFIENNCIWFDNYNTNILYWAYGDMLGLYSNYLDLRENKSKWNNIQIKGYYKTLNYPVIF